MHQAATAGRSDSVMCRRSSEFSFRVTWPRSGSRSVQPCSNLVYFNPWLMMAVIQPVIKNLCTLASPSLPSRALHWSMLAAGLHGRAGVPRRAAGPCYSAGAQQLRAIPASCCPTFPAAALCSACSKGKDRTGSGPLSCSSACVHASTNSVPCCYADFLPSVHPCHCCSSVLRVSLLCQCTNGTRCAYPVLACALAEAYVLEVGERHVCSAV